MYNQIKEHSDKFFYPSATFGVFNWVTLKIRDKQISTEYENYRISRYRKLFWPFGFCVLLLTFNNILTFFKNGAEDVTTLQRPLYFWVMFVFIAIPRYCFWRY